MQTALMESMEKMAKMEKKGPKDQLDDEATLERRVSRESKEKLVILENVVSQVVMGLREETVSKEIRDQKEHKVKQVMQANVVNLALMD